MKRSFILVTAIAGLLAAVFFAACGTATQSGNGVSVNPAPSNSSAAPDVSKAFQVDYKSEPAAIQAGQPTMLIFTVKDKQGATVKDLQIVHEKPMHVLVVSSDLAEFYHIHPEQQPSDGNYRVQHVFPNGGDYKIYTDFTPKEAAQVVEQIDVKVAGEGRAKVPLVADAKLEKTVEGLRVTMKPSADLKAGQELTLDFKAFDAASGKPSVAHALHLIMAFRF